MLWTEPWCDFPNTSAAISAFRNTLGEPEEASPAVKTNKHRLRPVAVVLAWSVFAAASLVFTIWPRFSQLAEGNAIISLTFSHAGQRLEECRKLSQKELNELPPNMRTASDCPRERYPVDVTFSADDEILFQQSLAPSGIWKDGESTVYYRMEVSAGSHELFIGMSDSGREQGYDYNGQTEFTLADGQHVVVEFDHLTKSFIFR